MKFASEMNYPTIVTTDSMDVVREYELAEGQYVIAHPPTFHGDESRAVDVWADAWASIEKIWDTDFSSSIYLEPSCFPRSVNVVEACWDLLHGPETDMDMNPIDLVCTVEPVPIEYHAHRQLLGAREHPDDRSLYLVPIAANSPRQSLPEAYRKTGECYIGWREHVLVNRRLFDGNVVGYVHEGPVNIDTDEDLEYARMLADDENITYQDYGK